ncbi:hypothetical protein NHF40_01180 [Maricaulaceae bacterium EIL42A08]|nr:hypothetical protein [Maricaulaceae bacterium EIL42A08]
MKAFLISAGLAAICTSAAASQEFAFVTPDADEMVFWTPEEGETSRFDISGLLGTCALPSGGTGTRFFQNIQPDPTSGLIYASANQCGATDVDLYVIDAQTGEATLLGTESGLGLPLYRLQQSFLVRSQAGLASMETINSQIDSSSAVASALEIQLPVDGASNRVGLTSGAFGNEQAFGVSYARVQGRFDVGLAYAQGDGGRNAGKVSVGFSW